MLIRVSHRGRGSHRSKKAKVREKRGLCPNRSAEPDVPECRIVILILQSDTVCPVEVRDLHVSHSNRASVTRGI
jgi:hypothetical protein